MVSLVGLLPGALLLINQVLAATVVLTSFSLTIYLLTHNFRSEVARAFCTMLAFVLIVYAGDVVLYEVETQEAALRWLRFQWIGISFVPAAYLHLSDALLHTTNLRARWRRFVVLFSYAISALFLWSVLRGDLLVYDGVFEGRSSHLAAGPLFWIFALYFGVTVMWGAANIRRARQRCLTRASRRRMAYLGLAFVAPGLGVFPYLVLIGVSNVLPSNVLQLVLLAGNVAVLSMIVLMAYSVAYFGAMTPDRVIKHNLIHYLVRGPFVGAVVIFTMLAVPKVQQILGLPRDTVLIFAVVAVIILLQLAINRAKPFIDRLIYRQDREEIVWIQTLDSRLLTSADLNSFLENTLAALCDLMRVRTGFVAILASGQHRLEAHCGDRQAVQEYLDSLQPDKVALPNGAPVDGQPFSPGDGFWVSQLYSQTGDIRLGILGVEARIPVPTLTEDEQEITTLLLTRAEEALEDRYLQQGVFDTLGRILPDIERLQRWRDATRYAGSEPIQIVEDSPIYSPEFQQWVKDALGHYWGGPKLTESPLLGLHIVRDELQKHGGNATHALRTVLNRAIERLRPEGEQSMTTAEWILYNILELKFVRGLKVREIAARLAMSESDLYRKQRVAIAEVARALADLEQDGADTFSGNGQSAKAVGQENHLDKPL